MHGENHVQEEGPCNGEPSKGNKSTRAQSRGQGGQAGSYRTLYLWWSRILYEKTTLAALQRKIEEQLSSSVKIRLKMIFVFPFLFHLFK